MSEISATAEMMRDAAHLMTQDGLRLIKGDAKVQGIRLFLTSWAYLLKEMSIWMETQKMAGILTECDIVKIAEPHIGVAQTYLESMQQPKQSADVLP